jgi:hypothetical protein
MVKRSKKKDREETKGCKSHRKRKKRNKIISQGTSVVFAGNITVNGPMFEIHDNQKILVVKNKDVKPKKKERANSKLPKDLNTPRARKYFARAIELQYMEPAEDGRYRWTGTGRKPCTAELAYFLGRVYNYKYTINGNAGENFPEESLNALFGVKRLYSSLTQVYNAQKPQRWRSMIDDMFKL